VGVQTRKLVVCSLGVAMFASLLLLTYILHARFFFVDVVFYSALQDVLVAAVFSGVLLYIMPLFRAIEKTERILLCIIWLLGGYAFAISVPTVLDRSLSFYLLEKLDQRGGGIKHAALEGVIVDEFMHEYRVLDARLTEQLESGTIVIEDGCVRLTVKGKRVAWLSAAFRAHLLPKHRQLLGEYSADLTTPLLRSSDDVDYKCR